MQTDRISIRAITRPPGYHWFGYYDKQQFDPSQRFLLGMEADFQHRRPSGEETIRVGMVDLQEDDKWIELGTSRAWCWQMGCMLQWRPGHASEILYNDRERDSFVCRIVDVQTRKMRTLPFPFFTVSPDGRTALGLDFERLEYMRPGYGYGGLPDRNKDVLAPEDAGIYRMDLDTDSRELILSLAELAKIPDPKRDLRGAKHYVNCLLFNPDGSRFVFLHRWRDDEGRGWPFRTRLMTARPDGSDLCVLVPGGCGHFNWRDANHLIVQANGFSLYEDKKGCVGQVGAGVLPGSGGHISYLPDNRWIVGDTYPNQQRNQQLYLFDIAGNRFVSLGYFYLPPEYAGSQSEHVDDEWRCDLHPRVSPDGRMLVIDSAHEGNGRQMYLVDVSSVVDAGAA